MRRLIILSSFLCLVAGLATMASETLSWPTAKTTVPETLDQLKALEERVKQTVERASAWTVGVLIREQEPENTGRPKMAAGSGVIVSGDGLVLTAGHVSGAPDRPCTVILPDGRTVKGKTLGRNDRYDSGMLQILDKPRSGKEWPHAPLGQSSGLKEGQWVISLGHPGGHRKDRPPVARLGRVVANSPSSLRTTCTIVGGDSGGPLFDLDGKLIGIHSRIGWSLTENVHVPIDLFHKDWDRLVAGEVVNEFRNRLSRAVLGVAFDDNGDLPRIASVTEGYPAEKVGLKPGDLIKQVDGRDVDTIAEFRSIMTSKKPGDKIKLVAERNGKKMTFEVTLAGTR